MTPPISKFEEEVATVPVSGVNVQRQRLFAARGWVYTVWSQPVTPAGYPKVGK